MYLLVNDYNTDSNKDSNKNSKNNNMIIKKNDNYFLRVLGIKRKVQKQQI